MVINNKSIKNFIKNQYTQAEIDNLYQFLINKNTFRFPSLDNGLFPAAVLQDQAQYTGYSYIWVRDNIHIAYAHYINGEKEPAIKNIKTLTGYFYNHKFRFEKVIRGELDHNDPMNRPHIRFDGHSLEEINQKWAHAENDALGYFLWFFCLLHETETLEILPEENELVALLVLYFEKIRYWEDEDSGHWEETRKIEASSIGAVVAALRQLKTLFIKNKGISFKCKTGIVNEMLVDELIQKGEESLNKILPYECRQADPTKNRGYDAALLFLIYPLNIVSGPTADQIISNTTVNLMGDHGIRRYIGDSYWSQDYKQHLSENERTVDFSDNLSSRDSLLKPGNEAQWCIFDPVISVYYGRRFQLSGLEDDLRSQIYHFNRSLGQLTGVDCVLGGFKCPEMYYLENGSYVPNDNVPLLWTQANLWSAFKYMKDSITYDIEHRPSPLCSPLSR